MALPDSGDLFDPPISHCPLPEFSQIGLTQPLRYGLAKEAEGGMEQKAGLVVIQCGCQVLLAEFFAFCRDSDWMVRIDRAGQAK